MLAVWLAELLHLVPPLLGRRQRWADDWCSSCAALLSLSQACMPSRPSTTAYPQTCPSSGSGTSAPQMSSQWCCASCCVHCCKPSPAEWLQCSMVSSAMALVGSPSHLQSIIIADYIPVCTFSLFFSCFSKFEKSVSFILKSTFLSFMHSIAN